MTVDVIIVTYNRAGDLPDTLEHILKNGKGLNKIIVVNNNSTDNTEAVLKEYENNDKIEIYNEKINHGCSGGRNFGAQHSTADIIIGLDDDAIITTENFIEKIINRFSKEPECGVLMFQLKNFYSKEIESHEFPADLSVHDGNQEFFASYFIGASWAMRRDVFVSAGGFDKNFFIYMDEVDISFRIINRGYSIIYFPEIKVLHKVSPEGRLSGREKIKSQLRHRLGIGYKYLPFKYRIISAVLWTMKILKMSKSPLATYEAIREYQKMKKNLTRETLTPAAIQYMQKNYGRLYY